MYKPVERIEVYMWDIRVGAVALDPASGYYAFAYYPHFSKLGIELSPIHMPVLTFSPSVFAYLPEQTYKRLPAMLADALPDDFGNNLIDAWMAKNGIRKDLITPLDRLAYMGKRSMGALEFKPDRSHSTAKSTAIKMASLVEAARRTVRGETDADDVAEAALAQIIQVGTSAGGARAKAAIAWNPETEEIRAGQFNVEPGFEHWLLKFDGMGTDLNLGSTRDYGRIEYAYYQMATKAGITMSPCRILTENGRAHFMTRRFDRDGNKKIHIQTLCAMAHLDYKQLATHDYAQLFLTIDQLGLGYEEMEEAFRRMAFNVMAANCDDHTKNFSFIMEQGGKWQLAPAYDITHAYKPDGAHVHQHLMSVNGKFKDITRKDLLSVASRFGIGTAPKVLKDIRKAVMSWQELAEDAGIDKKEVARIRQHHTIL